MSLTTAEYASAVLSTLEEASPDDLARVRRLEALVSPKALRLTCDRVHSGVVFAGDVRGAEAREGGKRDAGRQCGGALQGGAAGDVHRWDG